LFIWDFLADKVLGEILDWIYSKLVEFLGEFLTMMNGLGTELFDLVWVQGVVEFFRCFGWALYGVGIVVAVFEMAMEYQAGRSAAVRDAALGIVKGFLAASLFSSVPVELYKLCIDLQGTLSQGIAGASHTDGVSSLARAAMAGLNGYGVFVSIFLLVLMGYSVVKIFFANLKRGGILLIQIAVGSLYLFSVPRGYTDGFYSWCRQIAGLCLTAFLQTTILQDSWSGTPICCWDAGSCSLPPKYRGWPSSSGWIPAPEPMSCRRCMLPKQWWDCPETLRRR
jgi:hypothetical protein